MQTLSFEVSQEEAEIIRDIAQRAARLARRWGNRLDSLTAEMDITAAHANGMPLRLADLYAAGDSDFAHDVFGIHRHINRRTGRLGGCFVPRFARPED